MSPIFTSSADPNSCRPWTNRGHAYNGFYVFRGTSYSPAATANTFQWYIEGNSAGHRIAVKYNLGYARGAILWPWRGSVEPGNVA